SAEELADLPLPAAEVGAQDHLLLGIGELGGTEVLAAPAEEQAALARGAEGAHPLGPAPRGYEGPVDPRREHVDRLAARVGGPATPELEDARPPDADPCAGERGDKSVHDVAGEPVGCPVVRSCRRIAHGPPCGGSRGLSRGFRDVLARVSPYARLKTR